MSSQMSTCDYCCIRPSSVSINCARCSPLRSMKICGQCSIHVNQVREHSKHHPMSTYELLDIPLDDRSVSEWLCRDEIDLIEMIETCGLGNWSEIGCRMSRNAFDCQNHFEEIYFSRSSNRLEISFQCFHSLKHLIGENEMNCKDLQSSSIIYPLMLINRDEQKSLTYMPNRDEYEREYLNEAETRLPIINPDDALDDLQDEQEQDAPRRLIHKGQLTLLRSYRQILSRRFQLKSFIRDYALAFHPSSSPDPQIDLHHISRFLSADQYERLVFNHRRIRQLLDQLGCSTSSSSNGHEHPSPCGSKSKKRSSLTSEGKRVHRRARALRRRARLDEHRSSSIVVDDCSSSSCQSNVSSPLTSDNDELNSKRTLNSTRRSIRRVSSSSSTNASSKQTLIKEPLYTRRRLPANDLQAASSQRTTRSTGNLQATSDVSWDSSDNDNDNTNVNGAEEEDDDGDDDDMSQFSESQMHESSSAVSSRTRSHTPPHHPSERKSTRGSPNGKRSGTYLNGSSTTTTTARGFDPCDQSTPKGNRMLTRHQLVVQQASPAKRRRIHSNSIDDHPCQN